MTRWAIESYGPSGCAARRGRRSPRGSRRTSNHGFVLALGLDSALHHRRQFDEILEKLWAVDVVEAFGVTRGEQTPEFAVCTFAEALMR